MTKLELKAKVCEIIDAHADDIYAIGEKILKNPEMGYREFDTASLVAKEFEKLGIPYKKGLAVTGVKGNLAGILTIYRLKKPLLWRLLAKRV